MSIFFHSKANGIVNVKMVITEEKILSNIDKIQKLINPKSKKQIVKLEEDSYFKDLVESVKSYLLEYPKKNTFPSNVYSAAYGLVEFATNQFEENTKTIEDLIRKREKNIKLASVLRDATKVVKAQAKNWKAIVKKLEPKYSPDVAENLYIIGNAEDTNSAEYKKACKFIDVKVSNLEANLHIEIDMERIEDTSKALSYIGLEIAEALKYIPTPVEGVVDAAAETPKATAKKKAKAVQEEQQDEEVQNNKPKLGGLSKKNSANDVDIDQELDEESEEAEDYETEEDYEQDVEEEQAQDEVQEDADAQEQSNVANAEADYDEEEYIEETRFETKKSLWQKIKSCKLVRTINYILKIRVVLDYPALPDANVNK